MYVIQDTIFGCAVLHIQEGRAKMVAQCTEPNIAVRIATLLNQHGIQPCTTNDLASALEDLEQRQPPHPPR